MGPRAPALAALRPKTLGNQPSPKPLSAAAYSTVTFLPEFFFAKAFWYFLT